jgi:hypothetical protein
MYYWTGTSWEPISTGGGSDSAHIVSDTEPTGVASVGDLWIQPNGTAPPGSPGEGEPGPQGEPGLAATIEVAETITIDAGLPAEVINVGNENKASLSFKIPQGLPGVAGPQGEPGVAGEAGPQGVPGEAGPAGAQGIQGVDGIQGPPGLGIRYAGTVDTQGDLPASATQGDLYVVSTPEPARGFVWDEVKTAWQDAGPVQGPQGVAGPQGIKGDTGPAGADAAIVPATATVLGGVKIGSGVTVSADGTISVSGSGGSGYLPLSGGTMTGTIVAGNVAIFATNSAGTYKLSLAGGGVAVMAGSNLTVWTGAQITNYVPLVTPGTGTGVQFGSGGAALNRGSVLGKITATGMIELPTTAPAAGEAVRRDYVDGRVIAQAAGGAAPAVTGLNAGTLWVEY